MGSCILAAAGPFICCLPLAAANLAQHWQRRHWRTKSWAWLHLSPLNWSLLVLGFGLPLPSLVTQPANHLLCPLLLIHMPCPATTVSTWIWPWGCLGPGKHRTPGIARECKASGTVEEILAGGAKLRKKNVTLQEELMEKFWSPCC